LLFGWAVTAFAIGVVLTILSFTLSIHDLLNAG
jgi:hypothetical protein